MKAVGLAVLVVALSGCAAARPDAGGAPFDPARFFDGTARSHGTITTAWLFDEAFTASFAGRLADGALRLDERFRFASGERLQRWTLRRGDDDRWQGLVETEGADGALHAAVPVTGAVDPSGTLQLDYDGYAPGGDAVLHFRHRMTRRVDGTVLNRVRITKYGFPLAKAEVVFERVPQGAK